MRRWLNFPAQILDKQPTAVSLAIALGIALFFLIYWSMDRVPGDCSGQGDCVKYSEMAHAFQTGQYKKIDYPFNERILAPLLASRLSADVTRGFTILNGIAALVFIVCWYGMARKLGLRNAEFAVLIVWFFVHPLGFQFYYADPWLVDPLAYAFLALVSFLFVAQNRLWLWLAMCGALLVKESFVFITCVMIAAEIVFEFLKTGKGAKIAKIIARPSILGGVLVLVFYGAAKHLIETDLFPKTQLWHVSPLLTVLGWVREIYRDPPRLLVFIGALFCSTGIFSIFLPVRLPTGCEPPKIRNLTYFAFGSAGSVALGLVGGSDMSRIIFNGNILIFGLLLLSFRDGHSLFTRPNLFQLGTALAVSLIFAQEYMNFFPSSFEYGYYTQGHHVLPAIYFIMANIAAMVLTYGILKIFSGIGSNAQKAG